MISYDPHALFQMGRRGILKEWVELTLDQHDEIEHHDDKCSFLRRFSERRQMLRVVTRSSDHQYVITAYFDRSKPC
ncbi:MAG: DUF4258 domain-containing protein [Candidatus Schekmanbacteria bacterium]|nr:DUF4258 domain-containing protein [Candidatus Schekmanbacteria bacterium]